MTRGVPFTTAEIHAHGRQLSYAADWLLRGYNLEQTRVADAVADTGMRPDLLLRCENMHTLIEGWIMQDGRAVIRCHQAQVSPEWAQELTFTNGANRSPRFAAAAGLEWLGRVDAPRDPKPQTVGFVWGSAQDSPVSALVASCRCAQRWPYWFGPAGLWTLLHGNTATRLDLPLPEACDCYECTVSERHAKTRDVPEGSRPVS